MSLREFLNVFQVFIFHQLIKILFLEKLEDLSPIKKVQDTDIPVKILKDDAEFFAEYIHLQYNEAIRSSDFPNCFKYANIAAVPKQGSRNQNNN